MAVVLSQNCTEKHTFYLNVMRTVHHVL